MKIPKPATGPVAVLIGTGKGAFILRGDNHSNLHCPEFGFDA